jgi:hypothetical protein
MSLAAHGAYIFYGEYDPTSDIPDDNLDPGDQVFLAGRLNWYATERLDIGTFLSYSYYTPDKIDGEERFQDGQRLVFGGNARFRGEAIGVLFNLQYVIQGKNKVLLNDTLQEEETNSNGDEFFGVLSLTYFVTPKFTLRLDGDVRYYGESAYKDPEVNLPYSGERIRYALGPGFQYNLTTHLSLNSVLKGFQMDQKRDLFVEDDATYYGVNLDLGFRYVF